MAFFKEVYCEKCGKKTRVMSRIKLKDNKYICSDCFEGIPDYLLKNFNDYTYDDYKRILEYLEYSNRELKDKFNEDLSYKTMHVDTTNGLFYIDEYRKTKLILKLENVIDFDIIFSAETYKDGALSDKVYGKILMRIQMSQPEFYFEDILEKDVKVKAKKAFFKSTIEYQSPADMEEFSNTFKALCQMFYEKANSEYEDNTYQNNNIKDELQQAMTLFMLDTLDGITIEDIKKQRNRLIKTFHPDAGNTNDNKYATKINNAYDILIEYLSR